MSSPSRQTRDNGAPQARPEVRQIQAYEREAPALAIALDDNTSAFGAPPAALQVLARADDAMLTRYPASYSGPLRAAIAEYVDVSPDAVVVGCGSDDVLDCALRAYGTPGSALAYMDPTFVMARLFALTNALRPVPIPIGPSPTPNVDAFASEDAPVSYLCSPNNPTGALLAEAAVRDVLRRCSGLVILDEAYAEYAGTSWARVAAASPRMLALRTFSKAFGMAGLRVGYGIAHPSIVTEIEKVRGPYKVSAPGEQAALAALRENTAWMREHAAATVELRQRFTRALESQGLQPLPSAANFVLLPVADARQLARFLRDQGIAVRSFVALPGIGDAVRITIRTWSVMEPVLEALARAP